MVLLWHRLKNLLKHLYFLKCMCKYIRDRAGLGQKISPIMPITNPALIMDVQNIDIKNNLGMLISPKFTFR